MVDFIVSIALIRIKETDMIRIIFISILTIIIFPFFAVAQDLDGSKPLICSVVEVVECSPGTPCIKGLPDNFDFPQFIKINFKDKLLVGKVNNRKMKTSPIEKVETMEGKLILHGSQNGRAWNIVTSQATGKMTGTIAADELSFTVFGACIAQ